MWSAYYIALHNNNRNESMNWVCVCLCHITQRADMLIGVTERWYWNGRGRLKPWDMSINHAVIICLWGWELLEMNKWVSLVRGERHFLVGYSLFVMSCVYLEGRQENYIIIWARDVRDMKNTLWHNLSFTFIERSAVSATWVGHKSRPTIPKKISLHISNQYPAWNIHCTKWK